MSTALAKPEQPTAAEKALAWMMGQVEKRGARLENLLHPDMPLERFTESCRLAFAKNPDLTDLRLTDGASLLQALMLGARSGLDVHGHYGHLVSFQNKKFTENNKDVWKAVIVFMPDWKGMLATLKAAGTVLDADPVLVHEADEFRPTGGANAEIHHVPFVRRKAADVKGAIIAAYTRFLLPNGLWVCKGLMLLEDIERIEGGIKAKNGPWGGAHRGEMIKKSSFRQAWKWLGPTTADRAVALRIAALEEAETVEGTFTVEPPPVSLSGVAGAKEKAKAALQSGAWTAELSEMATASARQNVTADMLNGEPSEEEKAAILKAEMEPGSAG
jgi:recombinational DNA repair protein RecT